MLLIVDNAIGALAGLAQARRPFGALGVLAVKPEAYEAAAGYTDTRRRVLPLRS
jgi:hypothetical protein